MGELIKVDFNDSRFNEPAVSARELHEKLGVKKDFTSWFKQQSKRLNLVEEEDYCKIKFASPSKVYQKSGRGGDRRSVDYIIPMDTAKYFAMLSETQNSQRVREYFIWVEEQWNSPEAVKSRAIEFMKGEAEEFQNKIAQYEMKLLEYKEKVSYCDEVLQCWNSVPITVIAKDYDMSAKKMNLLLHEAGVQFQAGSSGTWVLYAKYDGKGYTRTYTNPSSKKAYVQMNWTQKGRLFIYKKLKEIGILPEMEKPDWKEIDPVVEKEEQLQLNDSE